MSNIYYLWDMKSSETNPIAFFEWYLDQEIYNDLNRFYSSYINNDTVLEIDKSTHSIIVNDEDSEPIPFEKTIEKRIRRKLYETLNLFAIKFENAHIKGIQHNLALYYHNRIKLLRDSKSLKDFPFFEKYLNQIENSFNWDVEIKDVLNSDEIFPFELIGKNYQEKKRKANKLYNSLLSNGFINGEKDDFINGFTGKKINNGINWTIQARRNRLTNKKSLIYFLNELYNKGHLLSSNFFNLNKCIVYTFRDTDGNTLKNIKQSKTNIELSNFQEKDELDEIIHSLNNPTTT